MSDGTLITDQQESTDSISGGLETPCPGQGLGRSSSASSFDSCSDLLASLENATENFDHHPDLPHDDDKEAVQSNEGSCDQASTQPDHLLRSGSFRECDGIMREEVPLHKDVKDNDAKEESKIVKENAYGISSAMAFIKVKSLAENTAERFSQLQTSFRLPTSYIFSRKNASQADNTASPTIASTDVSDEHLVEKGLSLEESGDDTSNIKEIILQPKELRGLPSPSHGDDASENVQLDNMLTENLLIGEEPGQQEHSARSTDGSADVANVNDSSACKIKNAAIDEVSHVDAVAFSTGDHLSDNASQVSPVDKCKSSDSPVLASSDVPQFTIDQGLEEASETHFETPISLSDFRSSSSIFSHPLRTFSSGSGRPDLEEADDEKAIAGGLDTEEQTMGTVSDKLFSADLFKKVGSEASLHNDAYVSKCSDPENELHNSRVKKQSLCEHSGGFSEWNCESHGEQLSWLDQPSLVEVVKRVNSDHSHCFDEQTSDGFFLGPGCRGSSLVQNDLSKQHDRFGPDELGRYVENLEVKESYVDTVLDMEDVLLNRDENSHRDRSLLASGSPLIGTPRSSRDGSLSSSTSGLQLFTSHESTAFTVDWVEVVGAKQRKGGSSLGERIVGVKDHTVYCIKVLSGNQEWEVLRRYRDFVDLYHKLRRNFNFGKERCLPSLWKDVERDSRKIFGSTHPNVIEVRSSRIEKCLQSLLQAGPPLSTSITLCVFLSPQSRKKGFPFLEAQQLASTTALLKGQDVQLGSIESPHLQSPRSELGMRRADPDYASTVGSLGKTVKLDLKIHPNKNMKLLLSAQHDSCAGCYKRLEAERGLVNGFVHTLGWGKPRLCEYSGQVYCTSCHLNESAVIPAKVLWHWDFIPGRVSQLAKAYLDSIYDQPMLCVSAVNPYLYSRVPILYHVRETRRKLSKMLASILCPFHARIFQTMGSRRYLLESNDFFALRDLEDLSKGAFAVLPSLLKAVLENLRQHITKNCSICSETAEWCGAGVLCEEPFSPIFTFEEENITTCKVCHTTFHKACFSKFSTCPACSDELSNTLGVNGKLEGPQMEETDENHRDVALLMHIDEANVSSSLAGTDGQGGFELDRQSHNRKPWPSLSRLLPKRRLW